MLARMLQNGLATDCEFETLRKGARFEDILRQLDTEA